MFAGWYPPPPSATGRKPSVDSQRQCVCSRFFLHSLSLSFSHFSPRLYSPSSFRFYSRSISQGRLARTILSANSAKVNAFFLPWRLAIAPIYNPPLPPSSPVADGRWLARRFEVFDYGSDIIQEQPTRLALFQVWPKVKRNRWLAGAPDLSDKHSIRRPSYQPSHASIATERPKLPLVTRFSFSLPAPSCTSGYVQLYEMIQFWQYYICHYILITLITTCGTSCNYCRTRSCGHEEFTRSCIFYFTFHV